MRAPRADIVNLVTKIENNIIRRKKELDQDLQDHQMIMDRIISNELAEIPGT